MDSRKFESNPAKQTALSLVCTVAGMALAIGFRHFDGSGMTNSMAGFLTGILLLVIGIGAFLTSGKQTIVIDEEARRIVIEDSSRFGAKRRVIPFGSIVHTGIGYLGKRSNHVNFYYIVLKRRSGEEYSLFAPGRYFDGGSDESVMERRRQQLEETVRRHSGRHARPSMGTDGER